jgi:TonB family protein
MSARHALNIRVQERIELLEEPKRRGPGVSIAIAFSLVLHVVIAIWVVRHYHPVEVSDAPKSSIRYVELLRNNPDFTEAPGKKVQQKPLQGLFSDANRKAATPEPTGDKPTLRPGNGSPIYSPPRSQAAAAAAAQQAQRELRAQPQQQQHQPQQQASTSEPSSQSEASTSMSDLVYHPQSTSQASAAVDWRSAIKEVGKVASLGGNQQNMDLGNNGGDKGFAENGPLSFETEWYDWGAYAQSMVSRIRVNWYANMPDLIRAGMKGVVTIRFTIQRSGQITDVTILNGSGIPPYDFAAKKAIELSSPLNPLPKDFPNNSERVTCMFYYNLEPPSR